MGNILYYMPTQKPMTIEKAREAGLGYIMDKGGPTHTTLSGGPDGDNGVVFTFGGGHVHVPEDVQWERIPNLDVYAGYDPANPPGPNDLARDKQLDGHYVDLTDGNKWLVPVARAINGTTPLPRRLRWDGSAFNPGDVLPQYAELFAQAGRVWEAFSGAAETDVTIADGWQLAAMALAINYRLGPAEISLLGLFDTESASEVVKALVDWPVLEEFKKKVDSGEVTLPSGNKD